MIVWAGQGAAGRTDTGGIYDPVTDTWAAMSTTGAPAPRHSPAVVWTGSRMIVWGGYDGAYADTGGIYDPVTDAWTATPTAGAPSPRSSHTAVWTGSRMIVWGGQGPYVVHLDTGGIYDPTADTWMATTTTGAPTPRTSHKAVWTGSRMIVWGGYDVAYANTGGIYDATMGIWTATTTTGAPASRYGHTAVWTGRKMIVWGGQGDGIDHDTGGIYDDPGFFPPSPTDMYTLTPCRVADTRNPAGPSGGPALGANTTRSFPVTGLCGVPSTATAVAINLTVVDETDFGHLRLYATGAVMLDSSTINFTAYKVRANNGVIPLGTGGESRVRCDMRPYSTGQTHFLFDVTGYFE